MARLRLWYNGGDAFRQLCQEDLGCRVTFGIATDLAGRIRASDFLLHGLLLPAPREQ